MAMSPATHTILLTNLLHRMSPTALERGLEVQDLAHHCTTLPEDPTPIRLIMLAITICSMAFNSMSNGAHHSETTPQ